MIIRQEERFPLETAGAEMNLSLDNPVTVRSDSGRIVTGVASSRFSLFIDGMRVPIRDLDRESDLPISLCFILDTSGSMAGRKMEACQQLITAFLNQRRGTDQVMPPWS